MRTNGIAVVISVLALAASGCNAPAPPQAGMNLIWLEGVSEFEAFETTRSVLREFDFQIEADDVGAGYLRTFPTEQTIRGGTGRISEVIVQTPNRIRRVAEAYVSAKPGGAQVRLAVKRQRLDTTTHRAFDRERGADDIPSETAIDLDTGSTAEQYETWTPIGRDRALETSIRNALEERLLAARSG